MNFTMLPKIKDRDLESVERKEEIDIRNTKSKFTLLMETVNSRNDRLLSPKSEQIKADHQQIKAIMPKNHLQAKSSKNFYIPRRAFDTFEAQTKTIIEPQSIFGSRYLSQNTSKNEILETNENSV